MFWNVYENLYRAKQKLLLNIIASRHSNCEAKSMPIYTRGNRAGLNINYVNLRSIHLSVVLNYCLFKKKKTQLKIHRCFMHVYLKYCFQNNERCNARLTDKTDDNDNCSVFRKNWKVIKEQTCHLITKKNVSSWLFMELISFDITSPSKSIKLGKDIFCYQILLRIYYNAKLKKKKHILIPVSKFS